MPRITAAKALAEAAGRFPDVNPPDLHLDALSPADRRLSLAIYRTAMQRWITLTWLLDRHLRKPMRQLDPAVRGVLLAGAAQLVFMPRLPAHAVVDESVKAVRALERHSATGLVNAVLRKLNDDREVPLPEPADAGVFLSITSSHPRVLTRRWIEVHGEKTATALCRHGVRTPPTWLVDGDHFEVWHDTHEALVQRLAAQPQCRVQDPTSASTVASTAGIEVSSILDYCAGRGTKSRQAATLHPQATVFAHDVDGKRLEDLRLASATFANIRVELPENQVDLLMLDVPCSNTGVLARRPEARYRFSNKGLHSLVVLQRQIAETALKHVRPGGWILYSTCSIEREENSRQTRWICEKTAGSVVSERLTLPAGQDDQWHDGGYHALIRLP